MGGDDSKHAVIGSSSCCFVGTCALEGSIFGPSLLPSLCLFLVHVGTPLAHTNCLSCIIGMVLCFAFLFCGSPSILLSVARLPFPLLRREANLPLSGHVLGKGGGELSEHARVFYGRAAEPSSCQCKMCQTHEWRLKCIIASPADMVQRPQKGDASACKHVCSSTPVRHGACPRIYSKVLLCQPPC